MTTQPRTRRRRRQYQEIEGTISSLARLHYTPPEIHEQLRTKLDPADVPSLRTVQRIVRELALPQEANEPWSFPESSDEDDRVALATLQTLGPYWAATGGQMVRQRTGMASLLSKNLVSWLRRIQTAVPGVPFEVSWAYAHEYIERERRDEDTEDLDYGLAWAPTGPETTGEFLRRVINHAKVHCEVWPERVFLATAFEPVSALVAGQVQAALTVLTEPSGINGSMTWSPSVAEPRQGLQEAIDEARRVIARLEPAWEEARLVPSGPYQHSRRTVTPENKWGALDEYIQRFIEDEATTQEAAQ